MYLNLVLSVLSALPFTSFGVDRGHSRQRVTRQGVTWYIEKIEPLLEPGENAPANLEFSARYFGPGTTLAPSLAERALVQAIQRITYPNGKKPMSILGNWDPTLCEKARYHSAYMASVYRQDHYGWGNAVTTRSGKIIPARFHDLANKKFQGQVEIVAESWPENDGLEEDVSFSYPGKTYNQLDTVQKLQVHAISCVKSWLQSSGHKSAMDGYSQSFCYSMAKSPDGKFFCTGIMANAGNTPKTRLAKFADYKPKPPEAVAVEKRPAKQKIRINFYTK